MIQLTMDVLLSRSYYTVKSDVTIDVMYSFTSYNNWCILNLHILLYLLYCNTYSELYSTVLRIWYKQISNSFESVYDPWVGWTDYCCGSGIFLGFHFPKIGKSELVARSAKFSLSKNHRDPKIFFCCCKNLPHSIKYSKEQLPNRKFEIKFKNNVRPPKWATWFLTWTKKKNYSLLVSLHLHH